MSMFESIYKYIVMLQTLTAVQKSIVNPTLNYLLDFIIAMITKYSLSTP